MNEVRSKDQMKGATARGALCVAWTRGTRIVVMGCEGCDTRKRGCWPLATLGRGGGNEGEGEEGNQPTAAIAGGGGMTLGEGIGAPCFA